ncbi:Ndr family [Teratosphaeria destructans]|uniref:Ndr family n=1 Tax=Teratosphaeria destructans TaxID=418781 RepID=A0A9W7T0I0_9PEZI|nr:Ndr family [Teratosphaeria destructans]
MPYATVGALKHRIAYFDTKDAEPQRGNGRPPFVMVHGLGSSQNYYQAVIGSESIAKYRCVALDSYGAARSRYQGEDLTLEQLGDDVLGLMDHLNIDRALIAGHSMGGTMVCTIAAKYPQRVIGFVAIGPVSPSVVNKEAFQQRINTVEKDGMEPLANSIPTAATNARSTPLQRALIRELIINQDPNGYAAHCAAIQNIQEPSGGYSVVKTPALILAGDEDKSAPMEGCEYILQHLGSSKKELKTLQGVGHWHCIEAADRVAQEMDAFATSI